MIHYTGKIAITQATQGTKLSIMYHYYNNYYQSNYTHMNTLYDLLYYGIPGSCSAAGFSNCCMTESCKGEPPNCYCDSLCHTFNDCCPDANTLCKTNNITLGTQLLLIHITHCKALQLN